MVEERIQWEGYGRQGRMGKYFRIKKRIVDKKNMEEERKDRDDVTWKRR